MLLVCNSKGFVKLIKLLSIHPFASITNKVSLPADNPETIIESVVGYELIPLPYIAS